MEPSKLAELLQQVTKGGWASAMSAVNPLAAGLQTIPELYKMGLAIKQGMEANKIRKSLVRPVMGLPPSMVEATQGARMQAMDSRLPGQQFAENNIARSQASANQGIMNAGGGTNERLAAMVAANQGSMDANNQLAEGAARYQAQDLANLNQQLNQQSNVEQQMWDYNQRQKFDAAASMASQLGTDSNRNAYSSLMGLGGAISSAVKAPGQIESQGTPQLTKASPAGGFVGPPTQMEASGQVPMTTRPAPSLMTFNGMPMFQQPQNMQTKAISTTGFNPNMQLPQRPMIPRPQYKLIEDVMPIEGYKPRGGFY